MKYYKILRDGKSCDGENTNWSLPWGHIPGEWCSDEIVGTLLVTEPYQTWFPYLDCDVYEAEPGEIIGSIEDNRIVTNKARLLRKLEVPAWLSKTREFVSSLSEIPWMVNDGNPNLEWVLCESRDVAARITQDSKKNLIFDTVKSVTLNLTYYSSREAVWNTVCTLSYPYSKDGFEISNSISLFAQCLIVEDLLDPVHFEHAKERMEVWQKGYGLWRDVNGVLFVYRKV